MRGGLDAANSSGTIHGALTAERTANVHAIPRPGNTVHAATTHVRSAIGMTLRRMLSAIFQRESPESGLRFAPVAPGTRAVNHRSSCQSPRIQRCVRLVAVRY